jgi:hypothetical protein
MSQKTFSWLTGILFIIISAIHLVRSILGWDISFNGWVLPIGVSVVIFLITAFLAYSAFNIDSVTAK